MPRGRLPDVERDLIYGTGFAGMICSKCDELKPVLEFSPHKQSRTGHHTVCRVCNAKKTLTARNSRTPDMNRDIQLRATYGISLADKRNMELDQRGACKICKSLKPLVVDHDHSTGTIRGLLCDNCNKGLGMFVDNQELLRRAAIYLNQAELAMVA